MSTKVEVIEVDQTVQLGNMLLSKVLVTPEWAEQVLADQNDGNRTRKGLQIDRVRSDIQSGDWITETAEFLKFDVENNLIDGQNRMAAVVKSGTPAWMLMAEGLPTTVREVIDQGVKRSGADVLGFHDENLDCNKSVLGAMLRVVGAWEGNEKGSLTRSNQKSSRFNISVTQLTKLYDEHDGDAVDAVRFATSVPRSVSYAVPTSVIAAARYLTMQVDSVAGDKFWTGWANSSLDRKADPRLAMNEMFREVHENTWDSKVTGIYLYGFFEAWNLWRSKKGVPPGGMQYRSKVGVDVNGVPQYDYEEIPIPR